MNLVLGFKDQSLTLDDLWQIFLNYGDIANIIIEGEGATVTFQDQCSFPAEANILMEVFYKDKKIHVMKLEGSNGLEGPSGAMIHQAQEVLVTGFFGILKKGMIVNPRRIYRGAVNPFLFRHCPSKLF